MTIIFRANFVGKMIRILSHILLFLLLYSATAYASITFTGRVVDVADGDTLTMITSDNETIKIRLAGIDCPEGRQAHGDEARQFLASKVENRRVRIALETIDQYGRTVGQVLLNGENINEQIVAQGHGWVYRKYCTADHCKDWLKLEKAARKARLGLWQEKDPKPPWEWRAEGRGQKTNQGDFTAKILPTVKSFFAKEPGVSPGTTIYHGNRNSKVFHGPSCKDYNCKNCVVKFRSIEEANRAGFRPHRECVKE